MTIHDISPRLSAATAVWPGDVALSRQVQMRLADGESVELSSLASTVHVGAHADAPSHFHREGVPIDQVDLEPYIGACHVVTAVPVDGLIPAAACEKALTLGAVRILFRTGTFPDPDHFNEDFAAFSPEAVERMGRAGVRLIGIDTPSVDPYSSKDLPSHQMLFKYDIRNLEGLVLTGVADGPYELIALPLKLQGFDASPVRAILRDIH